MSGGAVSDGWLWWWMEGEFPLAEFGKYKFGEKMLGPTVAVAVIDGLSFAFQWRLYPNGAKYSSGEEVRDHMGLGIALVDGPIDEVAEFKYKFKVYLADGSLELKTSISQPVTMKETGWHYAMALPMAADKLAPYVLGETGSEFVKLRVEFGFPSSAFDALAHLPPPTPRLDAIERLARWCGGGNGCVTIVAGVEGDSNRKEFTVHKDMLTEMSLVFQNMLNSAMTEDIYRRIDIDKSCGAVEEFINFIIAGSLLPTAIIRHALELLDLAERYLLPDLKRLCERTVVKEMQLRTLPVDWLDLLKAAKTYNLRVALNVGLCRLFKVRPQLSAKDKRRFNSAEFADIRDLFMDLSCQSHGAIKC